jgi:hypothetical protein
VKKHVLLLAIATTYIGTMFGDNEERLAVTSHTFFSVRPQYYTGLPIKESFWDKRLLDAREEGCGAMFEVVPFGGQTTNSKKLAGFFTPAGKRCLNVLEFKNSVTSSQGDGIPTKDLEARHFNIETVSTFSTFQSTISFAPRQKYIGVGLSYRHCFACNDDGSAKWWLELSAPIINVKNTMRLEETIINNGGGPTPTTGLDGAPHVGSMTAAFKQNNWLYGKIDSSCEGMSKTGLADIEAMIGLNWHMTNCCFMSWYAGGVFPTGNRPNGVYVFQPIVGNNKHFGVTYGSTLIYELWSCDDHQVEMRWDANSRYLFRNHQVRSFDLLGKPWSRYMEMYANPNQAIAAFNVGTAETGVSGINVLTRCVKVSPRFNVTLTTALTYHHCNWNVEAGYNFFARQAEKVELATPWQVNPALKANQGAGFTTIARNIKDNFEQSVFSVTSYYPIQFCDIDLYSAAHPAVLSHLIYATAGYDWQECCHPTTFAVGGSYEFGDTNAELERWTVWGKFVVAF